ncbi:MAG: cation acetate symporter, partial [Verrucomicrobiota bacterium]
PQMKGAGVTLAYVFPGLPYWVGVAVVGAVITLNVALGGMKGITLVQAFQYWAKMFAISVPIFVLMNVYGDYGSQLGASQYTATPVKIVSDGKTNDTVILQGGDVYKNTLLTPTQQAAMLRKPLPEKAPADQKWISPFGPLTTKAAAKAGLKAEEQKPFSLLYTYSLIIALVCGTAGLPHILVRFYTNPDGVAAKRTTMWVMILIGIFYVFPPVFGVMGRNLLPELYLGAGSKGTDKVVLELPRILNEQGGRGERGKGGKGEGGTGSAISSAPVHPFSPAANTANKRTDKIPWGSILSGITCAGAFAAFMSTFSGLLVSMTGALAHDVYGRILRPKSTPEQRMRMFKFGAVLIGGIAILLGTQVELLDINFMVGQAFAIAAASYFPLLFMSVWWRGMTQKGAATGMLSGGLLALAGITLTSVSDIVLKTAQKNGTPNPLQGLETFWIGHPGIRILCEQPAIWAVPLAIGLMIVVSKLTRKDIPADIRAKMLVLHAPEKLGLKQEYIQEQQGMGH